jgi:hypothetical protein
MAYKYGYEEDDLFVEQGTDRVPDDGEFYIVLRGHAIEHELRIKTALGRLQQLRHNPPTDEALADGTAESRGSRVHQGFGDRSVWQSTLFVSWVFSKADPSPW